MCRRIVSFAACFLALAAAGLCAAQEMPPVPALPEAAATAAVSPVESAPRSETATLAAVPAVATSAPTSIRVPDLTGDWCGSWSSCVNGHNGPMRARFCRLCDGNYEVVFTGRFCKLIPFRYKSTLTVTGYADGVVYLSGSKSLGPIFGTFTYSAWANDRQFVSSYTAGDKDQGQFTLSK